MSMDESLIAWHGTVELLNAAWSLDAGRTVELRLCGDAYDRIHPFKRFQKKRNGRVGTRFQAVFSRVEDQAELLNMEVMLAAWKDSSSIGQSILLWLDDEVEMHPFCGCSRRKTNQSGDVFALVLVELNDDDAPVRQSHSSPGPGHDPVPATNVHDGAAASEGAPAPRRQNAQAAQGAQPGARGSGNGGKTTRGRKLSSSVYLLVRGQRFLQWLKETKGTLVKEWTGELAHRYIKHVINVESLSDLDRDTAAVERYHKEIRRPYERWLFQEP